MASLRVTPLIDAILRAKTLTSSKKVSAGNTLFANPMLCAVSASMGSPTNTISFALLIPMARAKRYIPPAPGNTPIFISGTPNRALSDATIKSQASANSHPPPKASPFTAAITGLGIFPNISNESNRALAQSLASRGSASFNSFISAPAAKALPSPVTITTFTSSSSFKVSAAFRRSIPTAALRAFKAFGLFRRITAIPPSSFETSIFSYSILPSPFLNSLL